MHAGHAGGWPGPNVLLPKSDQDALVHSEPISGQEMGTGLKLPKIMQQHNWSQHMIKLPI